MKRIILILAMFLTVGANAQKLQLDSYRSAKTNFIAGYAFAGISLYSFYSDFENRVNRPNGETGLTMSNTEYLAIGSGIIAVILFSNAYSDLKESRRIQLQAGPTSFKISYQIGRK